MKKISVVDHVSHAATHPVSTTAWVFGVLRGFGAELIRVASGQRGQLIPGNLPDVPTDSIEEAEEVAHRGQFDPPHAEAAPQRLPDPPAESFVTQPTAVTRTSAHGRATDDADIDDWLGDAELDLDPSADPATGSVVEALERGDRPGSDQVDHGAVKSVLSEAERLRGLP